MKRVLIVSPHFPPVSAADMHRVRVSLPFFESFGWRPHVLAVAAEHQAEDVLDPLLLDTLPPDVPVTRVGALPLKWTRPVGVGNVALRAWPYLYRAGARIIRSERIDLVFFSTTMFASMALGRLWKRRFGVPYVLDMQDPWVSDYQGAGAPAPRPKSALARGLHAVLEPFTMRKVDGLISVSPAYCEALQQRYPSISGKMCETVPFGASETDFEVARKLGGGDRSLPTADGCTQGVYVGRGGRDMAVAAEILFRALAHAAARREVRLTFVGTAYAPVGKGAPSIAPIAARLGVAHLVTESPDRVPYFNGLRRLAEADFLIVLGSDDPQYSPSKVYPYLLARRPLVAILHEASPVVGLLRSAGAGIVVTFGSAGEVEKASAELAAVLPAWLDRLPFEPTIDPSVLARCSARELTGRQCALFDAVVAQRAVAGGVPCLE